MDLTLILGIFFFLIITFIIINYDKPVKKLDLSRYTNTTSTPNHTRLKEIKIKGQSRKYSEINDLKLIPETHYFSRNQWTIMFWITVHIPNKMVLVEKGCPLVIFDPPNIKFVFNTPSGRFETMDNIAQPITTSHFAWVQDNMTLRIFENSKPYLISDPNQNFTERLSNTDLKINAHIGNVSFRNFRIFNTPQSYNQILDIYKTEKPIITGEKYIKKKLTKEELRRAIKRGEIYSPDTRLKEIT